MVAKRCRLGVEVDSVVDLSKQGPGAGGLEKVELAPCSHRQLNH